MNRWRVHRIVASILLLVPCACATTGRPGSVIPRPQLPADVSMNPDAGHGAWLFVNVRLDDGPELPFFIDTGTNYTCFDKSLASRLGQCLGVVHGRHYDDVIAPESVGAFVQRSIPGSELVLLDATGHCPNLSAPAETIAAIKAFV